MSLNNTENGQLVISFTFIWVHIFVNIYIYMGQSLNNTENSFQFSQFISEAKLHSKTGQLKNRSYSIAEELTIILEL